MDEKLKKNLPLIAGAVAIVGGIIYLQKRGVAGSAPQVNTGYSVINPPDNSASVAAAAQLEGARMSLANSALTTYAGLVDTQFKTRAQIESETLQANTQISLANVARDMQANTEANQITAFRVQSEAQKAEAEANRQFQLTSAGKLIDYNLQSERQQNEYAFNLQKEQYRNAEAMYKLDTTTQNNAIKAQSSAAKRNSTLSTVLSLAGMAMMFFSYDSTENAASNRRAYFHGPHDGKDIAPPANVGGQNWRFGRYLNGV